MKYSLLVLALFFTSVQAYTLKNENSLISQLNDRVQSDIRILGAKEKQCKSNKKRLTTINIKELGLDKAKLAIALASREAFPYDTLMDNKSGSMIASYIEKPIAVYKTTIDETIIKDGFHSKDDIYRNVQPVK